MSEYYKYLISKERLFYGIKKIISKNLKKSDNQESFINLKI